MTTLTIARTVGLTSIERDVLPLEDGFLTFWNADARLRRRLVRESRRVYGSFRDDFGYKGSAAVLTSPDSQPKTGKSAVWTLTLMLVPARSVLGNACPMASDGCGGTVEVEGGCLAHAGKGGMPPVQYARLVRMAFMVTHAWHFGVILAAEIVAARRKHGAIAVRLNCVSDIRWERTSLAMLQALDDAGVSVYDYTAWAPRFRSDRPAWYHVTFSAKETHGVEWVRELVESGHNVAVPVFWPKGKAFPSTWQGMPAIDGDKTDYRPDDRPGSVVLLRAKGSARKDTSGFVREMVA